MVFVGWVKLVSKVSFRGAQSIAADAEDAEETPPNTVRRPVAEEMAIVPWSRTASTTRPVMPSVADVASGDSAAGWLANK